MLDSSSETAAANCDRAAATTTTDHKHDINEETSTKNELNQLRLTLQRYDEERKLLLDEITQLKEILKREVNQSENETKNNLLIINDYKSIRQTLDARLCDVENELDDIKMKISNCDNCCSIILTKNNDKSLIKTTTIKNSSIIMNDDDDDNDLKLNRIRELELELAQTKLAHVEAECRNQDLTHQLRATELELNTAKNSWPPWLSKTLTSIKEVANNNKKDFTSHHFPYPPQSINNITTTTTTTPSFISHINNSVRRDSVPLKKKNDPYISSNDSGGRGGSRRESAPIIIKDSQSCSSLKTQN